jgi:uncharacterized protein (DUF58 family)
MTLRFDPSELRKYGGLTMVARTLVEGFLTGVHKSPYKGFSVEFAEHRQYYPGDEIRHIDWRVYGKTDRYYIKEYEEETNAKAHLLVDARDPGEGELETFTANHPHARANQTGRRDRAVADLARSGGTPVAPPRHDRYPLGLLR